MKNYVIAIVIPLIIALLTWGATAIYRRIRIWRDGCKNPTVACLDDM